MNKKTVIATLSVISISGGLLAASAFVVPAILNTTVMAKQAVVQQEPGEIPVASADVPVLKIEADNPVSTVRKYLEETMSTKELQIIYDYIDEAEQNEAPKSNRLGSDAEVNRRLELEDQYVYEGLRPQATLPLQAGSHDFYFDIKQDTYHYPDRALTDEELLQSIDWSYRVNFALSKRNAKNYAAPVPGTKDISKAEALALAKASVKKLFAVDVSKMEAGAMFTKYGPAQKSQWFVHFQPYKAQSLRVRGESYWDYTIFIDSLTNTVLDTTRINPSHTNTRKPIDAAQKKQLTQDKSWLAIAKAIVVQKQGDTRKIASASFVNDPANDKRGLVTVAVKLAGGGAYRLELFPDKTLRTLIYEQ